MSEGDPEYWAAVAGADRLVVVAGLAGSAWALRTARTCPWLSRLVGISRLLTELRSDIAKVIDRVRDG